MTEIQNTAHCRQLTLHQCLMQLRVFWDGYGTRRVYPDIFLCDLHEAELRAAESDGNRLAKFFANEVELLGVDKLDADAAAVMTDDFRGQLADNELGADRWAHLHSDRGARDRHIDDFVFDR